jgi:DNA adenine methylase
MMTYQRSPMNYMGGKYKLLPQILPLFPKNINVFVDLFAGGLDVSLNVSAESRLCVDLNTPMITLYKELQKKPVQKILKALDARVLELGLSKTNADGYLTLRKEYNTHGKPLDLFALIAHSFNHQARFNNDLKFNTPFGKDRSCFNDVMRTNLSTLIRSIQTSDFQFVASDFRKVSLDALTKSDFVYTDPPYLISSGTYNDGKRGFGGWGIAEDKALRDLLDRLHSRGVQWAMSNVTQHKGAKNKELIDWARKYKTHELVFGYNNSNYQSGARTEKTVEVLITNVGMRKRNPK